MSWQITTKQTTTITFYGSKPATVTCGPCATQTYTGTAEVLTFPSGLTSQSFTLVFNGANLNCLCSMVESVVPIGDLSPAVAKELEIQVNWANATNTQITSSCLTGTPTPNVQCSFGFFLTTNSTLWQTNNPTWTPYNDPTVAMFDMMQITGYSGGGCGGLYDCQNEKLMIQQNPGETIQQEDAAACGTGSVFACVTGTGRAAKQGYFYMDLNFTGASGTNQVGGSVNCETLNPTTNGGPGCSFITFTDCGIVNCQGTFRGFTAKIPSFQLSGQTYYFGLWLGASELGSPIVFCYDAGSTGCAAQQTFVVNGCTSASLEIDYCVPTPCSGGGNNCVSAVTDSGGFFGSVWHGLTTLGGSFASVTRPIWGLAASAISSVGGSILNDVLGALESAGSYMINTAFPALEAILVTVLNTIGNLIFPGSNIGTTLQSLAGDIIQFFTQLPVFFANFPAYFTDFINWLTIVFPFISPFLSIATGILAVGGAIIVTAVSIGTTATSLVFFGYGTILIFLFIVFVGDDGVGGVLTYLGTAQSLAFKIINFIVYMTNFGLDILTFFMSIIPKPFVQMSAGKIPRLPSLDFTGGAITFPRFDWAELRAGNVMSVLLLMVGLYLDIWYESQNPALPGSIGSVIPGTAAAMQQLGTLLPLFKILVFVSGGISLFYVVMSPVQRLGIDLGVFEQFGIGLGGRQGPGPGGFKLSRHVEGRIQQFVKARGAAHEGVAGFRAAQGHIQKGIGTSGAVSTGALFD